MSAVAGDDSPGEILTHCHRLSNAAQMEPDRDDTRSVVSETSMERLQIIGVRVPVRRHRMRLADDARATAGPLRRC